MAGASGNYWSASKCGNNGAYYAVFSDGDVNPSYNYGRSLGVSVRLVSTSSVVLSHSVTAQPNPAEGGTIEGAGTYPKGQTCTLTAMANEGYYFVNWTENDEVVSTDATYIFEVIGDRDLVANFNQNQNPTGSINGKFTVDSNGVQVYFSQGNLQYIGSAETPYWKFADNQWDYLGTTTGQNSDDQNVDRDLFGWGTSGYNHGAICYQPWSTSQTYSDYYAYGSYSYNLYDQTGQADWGLLAA